MKIKFIYPFDLCRTPIEIDSEKDCEKYEVNTKGIVASNRFLIALWNEMNINIRTKDSKDRVPWAYFPKLISGKKSHILELGFIKTSLGELFIALSFKKKGDIDAIHFYSLNPQKSIDLRISLQKIVGQALKNINLTRRYLCKVHIIPQQKYSDFKIESYSGSNFYLSQSKYDYYNLSFYTYAIDKFEAEQSALENLYDFVAFLSVETNIYHSFSDIKVYLQDMNIQEKTNEYFVDDYIDSYPSLRRPYLCLSRYAVLFIDKYIFNRSRFIKRAPLEHFFLSACKHCQIGIETEQRCQSQSIMYIGQEMIKISDSNLYRKGEFITSALMAYLSSLECVTASENKPNTCLVCGAPIYKIASRVKDITTKYLSPNLGKTFHKLYGYRSKFLHAGRFVSDANMIRIIPITVH